MPFPLPLSSQSSGKFFKTLSSWLRKPRKPPTASPHHSQFHRFVWDANHGHVSQSAKTGRDSHQCSSTHLQDLHASLPVIGRSAILSSLKRRSSRWEATGFVLLRDLLAHTHLHRVRFVVYRFGRSIVVQKTMARPFLSLAGSAIARRVREINFTWVWKAWGVGFLTLR